MDESLDPDLTYESLIHDLNNVFETITETAELLSTDRHWKPLAATLRRCVVRGKRLVGAIPDSTPDLAAIVDDAIQSNADYCHAARRPRMEFHRNLPPGLRLPGTAKDWERVFVNLFLNAVQAIHKPGRIDISVDQGEALVITVADNGPGIPPEILPRIFRPNVTTKTGSGGRSGLGLHIVASIIRKNGGKITAANRETGKGAIFRIQLPVA